MNKMFSVPFPLKKYNKYVCMCTDGLPASTECTVAIIQASLLVFIQRWYHEAQETLVSSYCAALRVNSPQLISDAWAVVGGTQDLNHECSTLCHSITKLSKRTLVLKGNNWKERGDFQQSFSGRSSVVLWYSLLINKLQQENDYSCCTVLLSCCFVLFSGFNNSLLDFYPRRRSPHGNSRGHFLSVTTSSNKNTGVDRCVWLCPVLF